ncbi:hypothetical protein CAOG_00064 [Capsaspora owczarzaki ATCC 30864]|uniref:UspA domain-containing protein n=1 Tax=Capsaspora owczarzaki (strain ATCC 30864) TaxID=595528 RepID=A0A0D2WG99_CAPO3|nr:hypothetical protein CAOG_00064 [Capsaspora owczarzaki ATCC 30864]KJE88405.1 hypothetical protein CAOG_000064 [Capsaspora owczarzaki ATCC 30864]|eukprot:XP_004364935.1 hypothetical protein CAOG_00064 [Capsaspora owczarzaki ATCC 30864]
MSFDDPLASLGAIVDDVSPSAPYIIMVAVDGSECADRALRHAVELAARMQRSTDRTPTPRTTTTTTTTTQQPTSRAAVAGAAHTGVMLVIIHATALNPPQPLPFLDNIDRAYNIEAEDKAKRVLEKYKRALAPLNDKIAYFYHERHGDDVDLILESMVNEQRPDMLIMGTRALSGFKRFALGSVSEHAVHHLNIPVCIVK